MASALPVGHPTIVDVVRASGPDGKLLTPFVDPLLKKYAMFGVLPMSECNDGTGHIISAKVARPTLAWRKINQGIDPSKSRYAQIRDTTGILEGRSEIDKDLVQINGNTAEFRLTEEQGFVDQFVEEISEGMFHANIGEDPEKFHGIAQRYNDLSDDQVIDGEGSSGGNASIWLMGFSPQTIFGIYPKGTPGGMERQDMGLQYVDDRDSKKFLAWVTNWKWKIGLCVRDERFAVRICNIERSALIPDLTTGADLMMLMTKALDTIETTEGVFPAFFMDRDTMSMLRRQTLHAQRGNYMGWDTKIQGLPGNFASWAGVPIFRDDALNVDEDDIS